MTTTIKDIARIANVSNPAVSAVLNNKTNCRVSPATREKILHIAKELKYTPHFSGLLLRGEKTKTVALLISMEWQKSEEYMKDLIIALMSQFDQKGYACYFAAITGDANTNYSKVLELISRGVLHFVFLGQPVGRDQIKELIENSNRNYIVYGPPAFLNRSVDSDSPSGAASIIRFFLARGKSNFRLLINSCLGDSLATNSRVCGLMKVFPDIALKALERRYVVQMDNVDIAAPQPLDLFVKAGYEKTAVLLKADPGIQAIFYLSDFFAIGGAKLLCERGFTIGKDILLAGFNETSAVKNYPHPISSVEHNIAKITETIVTESLKESLPFEAVIPTIVHIRE